MLKILLQILLFIGLCAFVTLFAPQVVAKIKQIRPPPSVDTTSQGNIPSQLKNTPQAIVTINNGIDQK